MDSDQLALAFFEKREARSGKRRARSDPVALPTEKLLAALLGPAAERVCEELTEAYGGLRRLAAIHPLELRERGLKPAAVERLRTVFELARRFGEEEFPPGAFFRGSYDVCAHFRERLAAETVEYFVAVLLDNKNRKLRDVVVSMGSLTSSIVHPRLCGAAHKGRYDTLSGQKGRKRLGFLEPQFLPGTVVHDTLWAGGNSMTNLNVSLPEAMKDFIESEVKRGGYSTPSEFVRELVRDFQRRKATEHQDRLIEALLSGEAIADDPALESLHQKLRARIDDKLHQALNSPALPGEEVMDDLVKKSEARLQRKKGK